MTGISNTQIGAIISNYVTQKENTIRFGRKKIDAEKEYNRLLTKFNGEEKSYSLSQADNIYRCYLNLAEYAKLEEQAKAAFMEAEEQLKEVGRILFEGTIYGEIAWPDGELQQGVIKSISVSFQNDHIIIREIAA